MIHCLGGRNDGGDSEEGDITEESHLGDGLVMLSVS